MAAHFRVDCETRHGVDDLFWGQSAAACAETRAAQQGGWVCRADRDCDDQALSAQCVEARGVTLREHLHFQMHSDLGFFTY